MNLDDLLFLATKGVLIALVPLTYIWVRHGQGRSGMPGGGQGGGDQFARLAWVTAFITLDLIVFGGFTRLTDSGLGCPDWPGCYAKANPFAAASDIHLAETAMPSGPVTMSKAWIEMIHRYLAMAVGFLIIVMVVLAWLQRHVKGRKPWMTTALLALVCLQGAFGAWTVTLKLQPVIVTTHLLLALSLLTLLVWHASQASSASVGSARPASTTRLSDLRQLVHIRPFARIAATLLATQLALGGWVSTNYAVLACPDLPLCQGKVIPDMDFAHGFQLWRALGRTADQDYLPFGALVAIHWVHRNFAVVVVIALAILAWQLRRTVALRRHGNVLALLLLAQASTGMLNVLLTWPLAIAVLHNAGAAALVWTLTVVNYKTSQGMPERTVHVVADPTAASLAASSLPDAHATGS